MDPITLIILVVIAFLFLGRGGGLSTGLFGTASNVAPQGTLIAPSSNTAQLAGETQVANQVSGALNAIPVVGSSLSAAFNAISGGLIQASAQRAKQARTENAAVAQEVPLWDQGLTQILNAYNNGQVSAAQASSLLDTLMAAYFQAVTPSVQPGRNGCQSGAYPDAQALKDFASNPAGECSGTWGAMCCVGYASLWNSVNNVKFALTQTDNTGKSMVASIIVVNASKYGGINRPAYTVTVTRPS